MSEKKEQVQAMKTLKEKRTEKRQATIRDKWNEDKKLTDQIIDLKAWNDKCEESIKEAEKAHEKAKMETRKEKKMHLGNYQ